MESIGARSPYITYAVGKSKLPPPAACCNGEILNLKKRYLSMTDDLKNRGKQDDIRINVNQDHELRDWSKRYRVTPDQLKAAVKAVGPIARDVLKYLGK